jgi:hypothetical protein
MGQEEKHKMSYDLGPNGYWTLDLLSLQFHFEKSSGVWQAVDSDLNAGLQDLLLDPVVLDFRRKPS